MSFNEMTLVELKKIAEEFGVDAPVKITKNKLIEIMQEEGVTYEIYSHFDKIEKDKQEQEAQEQEQQQVSYQTNYYQPQPARNTVVKMERLNPSYQVGRYTFTQQHPYVAMSEQEAQAIFNMETGFRLATPAEVQNFYS